MRKILLASSALVGVAMLAAPAFAGDLTVKLSGYDTAMLGFNDHTGESTATDDDVKSNNVSMENLFDINVSVEGKGSNNLDYGAMISIWNGPNYSNAWTGGGSGRNPAGTQFASTGSGVGATEQQAYVWMSNNWGKAMFGDAHGASDLFVYAPPSAPTRSTATTSSSKTWLGIGAHCRPSLTTMKTARVSPTTRRRSRASRAVSAGLRIFTPKA